MGDRLGRVKRVEALLMLLYMSKSWIFGEASRLKHPCNISTFGLSYWSLGQGGGMKATWVCMLRKD